MSGSNRCPFCKQGMLERQIIPSYLRPVDDSVEYIMIKHVPGEKCNNCSMFYASPQVENVIVELSQKHMNVTPDAYLTIPVFNMEGNK